MCDVRQCCAPTQINSNIRCINQTTNTSEHHCAEHYTYAIELYKKYKHICNVAYKLYPTKEIKNIDKRIEYLNYCHDWFVTAYNARLEHRNYAFVPECFDSGHNFQFEIIQDKINICNTLLYDIYNNMKQDNSKDNNLESDNKTIDIIIEKVKKFKKKQKQDDRETQQLIDSYMKENEELFKQKAKIVNLCYNAMTKILSVKYNLSQNVSENIPFAVYIGLYHLTRQVYHMGYLEGTYKPIKCTICDCGGYIGECARLGCNCVNGFSDIKKYLNTTAMYNIKKTYELLITYSSKLDHLIDDIILYYNIYDDTILDMKFELVWEESINRLKLMEDNTKIESKRESLAIDRLKKKKRMEKYEDEVRYYRSIYDSDEEDNDSEENKSNDSNNSKKSNTVKRNGFQIVK
jgi:hypothetical protein